MLQLDPDEESALRKNTRLLGRLVVLNCPRHPEYCCLQAALLHLYCDHCRLLAKVRKHPV